MHGRERALAMQLAYGTVQRRMTLDHLARALLDRPLGDLEHPVLAALRLGLFQILFLRGVADHAAVNETVELVKPLSPRSAGLLNAVLRRATREGPALMSALGDHDPKSAAVLHSVPDWLARLWFEELGADAARALLRAINEPAESALRINRLMSGVQEVIRSLPVPVRPVQHLPEAIVLQAPFDAHGSELWRRGQIMPQSRASMLVARVLGPCPGDHVLDLCAAPGAKSTHAAALMKDRGSVLAIERHKGRAAALQRTCARMHAACVRIRVADACSMREKAAYDRVLVDPPCSGLGTLQSRPDLRWRVTREAIDELAGVQERILAAAARATRPGGVLVYSVCTISAAEGERVIERFLSEHGDYTVEDLAHEYPHWRHPRRARYLQLLPHRDGTDGFFIVRLRRG